jgi:hypothetical protein
MAAHADAIHTIAAITPRDRRVTRRSTPGTEPSSLVTWYLGLTHHWMNDSRPRIKTRILLKVHEWIIDRVLCPEVGPDAAMSDLRPNGPLARELAALVPPDDTREWGHFVEVVVANLRHALLRPVSRRNEAWVRWLFLIPYSIRQTAEIPAAPAEAPAPASARPCCGA